jgi:signal recognition particle receptor subunit beta
MCRPAAKVSTAKVPAAMMTAAEMRVAVTAPVTTSMTTSMTAAVATAMTTTSRDGESSRRQRGRQDNDGNPDSEF